MSSFKLIQLKGLTCFLFLFELSLQVLLNDLKAKYLTANRRNPKLREWFEYWLEHKTNILDHTKSQYRRQLMRVADHLGDMRIKDVDTHDLQRVVNLIAIDHPRAAQKTITRLRTALDVAFHSGIINRNPAQILHMPKIEAREYIIWQGETIQRFIAECQGKWHYPAFRTALGTGVRPGELIALKWEDLKDDSLHIRRTVSQDARGMEYIHEATKTKAGTRRIELASDIVQIIEGQKQKQVDKAITTEFIFPTRNGTPVTRTNLRKALLRLCDTHDLTPIRTHDLRHTFISMAIRHMYTTENSHWDLVKLSRYIGHSNPAFTLQKGA